LISQFGKVYLLDLHSFFGLITDDVCLGNANGASCSEPLIAVVEQAFSRQGYGVVRNKVFSGGHITRHYGQLPQVEALQIEVRYPLYLDPEELELAQPPTWKTAHFEQAKQVMERVFKEILSAIAS
jgi:N-formylglutamate amidohydrolase